ncbi:MAG: putative toxin-antitoxin system toxin component, PIN family [Spirochaetales bacterium]|nr:putative toxin-antitoxin system toxin component, PIN family [Spirochaetales bacterium]
MKIVLDTNVLVSGMLFSSGPPGRIMDHVRTGKILLVTDDRILDEYTDILRRDFMDKYTTHFEREVIIDFLYHETEHIVSTVIIKSLPDKNDIPFLEASLTASVPLVTGNLKHFPVNRRMGCKVLTPKEFYLTL